MEGRRGEELGGCWRPRAWSCRGQQRAGGTEPPGPAEDVSATQCKQGARVLVIEGPDQLGLLKRRCPRKKASRLTGSLSPDGL